MNIKPALSNLSERSFNNFFKTADPTLFSCIELDLSDTWCLDLFEFFHTKCLSLDWNVIDAVILEKLVAFSSYVNHCLDNLFFDKEWVEAKIGELLWEVMLWNRYHTELRYFSTWWLWWKRKICLNHIFQLVFGLFHSFVYDNPVHCSTKV
jgi:hypothetical protein